MSIAPSVLRDIANEIQARASALTPLDDIAARLRALADEQEQQPKPKAELLGRFSIDVDVGAVERAAEQLRSAAEAASVACERIEALTGGGSAGALGEALRELVAETIFAPIVEAAQARKDGQP